MTGRERILAAFNGGAADLVPFAPNIYLWFYYHRYHGTLPAELADAQHPFDVLRHLDADILARWDTQWAVKEVYNAGEYRSEFVDQGGVPTSALPAGVPTTTSFNIYPPGTNEHRRRFVTPHGTLTQTWSFTAESAADFEAKYWWTDWDEYEAVRFMLEARDYTFDAELFRGWFRRVGDDGVVMCHITQSPLKMLHWLAGPQNATYFIMDHPEETKALARIHEEKALALLEQVVDLPETEIFFSGDNLDSMFYPPRFYRDYCDSFFTPRRGDRPPPRQAFRGARLRPQQGAVAAGRRLRRGLPGRDHAAAAGRRSARRCAAPGRQARFHRQRRHGLAAPGAPGRRRGGAARLHARAVSPAWAICGTSSMRRAA